MTGTGDFTAYTMGLCFASACTSLTDDEAVVRMNAEHPSGTRGGWWLADARFRTGEANGTPCDQRPRTHRHLLFEC